MKHQRLVAWLAMAAMWLTIVAPVVSRTLPGMGMSPAMAGCGVHGAGDQHPELPLDPADPMDHCGYCTLLMHSPLVSGGSIVFLAAVLPAIAMPRAWASSIGPVTPVLSASPRGPPLLRHG